MAAPPEIVRIKRKRTDEPVDSLYVEDRDRSGPTKRRARGIVFRRQTQDISAFPPPSIPRIIATGSAGQSQATHAEGPKASNNGAPLQKSSSGSLDESANIQHTEPLRRKFHLSRSAKALVPEAIGKRKHRTDPNDVAVIIEESELHRGANGAVKRGRLEHTHGSTSTLKRPTATVRIASTSRNPGKHLDEVIEPNIQAAMRRFAEEEVQNASEDRVPELNGEIESTAHIEDTMMADINEEDYVFDTFVRQSTEPSWSVGDDSADRIGYLIIGEEDQELWEAYADEDSGSEKDWDSEQDDENAENYYGADYPEDELDFEDEYDEDAYRYRNNAASDDEEFDLEHDSWSETNSDDNDELGDRSNRLRDSFRTPADIHNAE